MAGPIAHIFCALAIISHQPDHYKKEFIIGTSLPDIRYLGVIDRTTTHTSETISWENIIKCDTPFKAGFLFHSLIDQRREEFYEKNGLYDSLSTFHGRSQLMKLHEDRYLFEKLNNRSLSTYFDKVIQNELYLKLPYKDIWTWHFILRNYLQNKPTVESIEELLYKPELRSYLPYYAIHLFTHPFIGYMQKHLVYLENHILFNSLLKEFYGNLEKYVCN